MRIFFIALVFSVLPHFLWSHPVHVSVTNIEFNIEKRGFLISFKIFYDDLETSILQTTQKKVSFKEKVSENDLSLAKNYIVNNFNIKVNEKELKSKLKFATFNKNHEAIWLYFTLPFRSEIKIVEIQNSILMNLYDDQTNLIIIKYKETEKGFTLKKDERHCTFEI